MKRTIKCAALLLTLVLACAGCGKKRPAQPDEYGLAPEPSKLYGVAIGNDLEIVSTGRYAGLFVEDGTDETVSDVFCIRELDKPLAHVQNVIDLLDQGNTIPFIARYRKELHGSMDDTALRTLEDRLSYLRNLDQRRQEVKNAIDGQGKLTDELSAAIDSAATLAEVEDLYRPYKQKRRTRATVAREKGLEPLALLLLDQGRDCPAPEEAARDYVDPEKGVETLAAALQGANDIVAELLSDDAAIRKTLRELLRRQGHLRSLAATEEDTVYRLYYDFDQPIAKLAGHQVLAINRGEKEGVLSVTVLLDRELGLMTLRRAVVRPGSRAMEFKIGRAHV